ncbi:hypothetical protein FWK35_00003473 [Aphis craccivora]|uniref:Uncharacterized protein n=1 Tax=Aphis craccivora TaxID=307492 RepID=A0A6G0ZPZ3_APHCR|nr:hypothetical protein FWK35_00015897 [Aphis craccivora]KAF0765457.1 hypothetical protein FWK35_00012296 [Aphis craccivora]KAF0773650.1 hypothetical protein FWK35_00003473 [Aphis craccivora]
MFMSVLSIYS